MFSLFQAIQGFTFDYTTLRPLLSLSASNLNHYSPLSDSLFHNLSPEELVHGFGGLGLNSVGVVLDLHCLVVWVGRE